MPFREIVVAGVNLIRTAIQSIGYTAGVTGWRIEKNGNAFFNNISAIGDVTVSVPRQDGLVETASLRQLMASLFSKLDQSVNTVLYNTTTTDTVLPNMPAITIPAQDINSPVRTGSQSYIVICVFDVKATAAPVGTRFQGSLFVDGVQFGSQALYQVTNANDRGTTTCVNLLSNIGNSGPVVLTAVAKHIGTIAYAVSQVHTTMTLIPVAGFPLVP